MSENAEGLSCQSGAAAEETEQRPLRSLGIAKRIGSLSSEENDFVVISVTDEGKGIAPEDQQVIWQKFSRLNEQNEGTGLGLYLVKYFVEAHNGAVFINSQVGKGSTIGFKLPLN